MKKIESFIPSSPHWNLDWESIEQSFSWIRKLRGSTQDPLHHAEGDVLTHTRMVTEAGTDLEEWRNLSHAEQFITFSAFLGHDVCKPETWEQSVDGAIRNPGHSRMGANEMRQILWRMGVDFSLREKICSIISVHQTPFWLITKPEWQARKILIDTSLKVPNRLLAIMAQADATGRICKDQQSIIESVELFRVAAQEENCFDNSFEFYNDHTRMQYFRDPQNKDSSAQLWDTTDPNFVVTIMSGFPASGKSTWIARETSDGGLAEGNPIVSMDRLRIEMKIKPQDNQGEVRQAALKKAKEYLAQRRSFVWDAINLDEQRRAPLISLCLDYGARIRFVYIEVPESEMRARNRAREHQVPDAVIDNMMRKWSPPSLTECHELCNYVENLENTPTASFKL